MRCIRTGLVKSLTLAVDHLFVPEFQDISLFCIHFSRIRKRLTMLVTMVMLLFASQAVCVETARSLRLARDQDPVMDDFSWDLLTEITGVDADDHLEKPGQGGPESLACTEASHSTIITVWMPDRRNRNPAPIASTALPPYQPGPTSPTTPETSLSKVDGAAQRPRAPVGRRRVPRHKTSASVLTR